MKSGVPLRALSVVLFLSMLLLAGCSLEKKSGENSATDLDPNLEAALRENLDRGEGPLVSEDWELLEQARFLGRSIENLEGFQQAVNLRELNLRRNEISDLAPLSALPHLETLILADNKIADISRLNGDVLSPLRHLDLSINEIKELAALDWNRLENLVHLDIRYNYISLQDEDVAGLLKTLADRGVEVLTEPMY